jgi:D-glycero-D-manno-heptose 1,7-bisphosphate phosphatase
MIVSGKAKSAVFLDRDGTLNFDPGYLNSAEKFRFLPGVKSALKLLAKYGFDLFVVSNQSGIGRGLITQDDLEKIHGKMVQELKKSGVVLKDIFVCPHSPEVRCACRKPSPKLLLDGAQKHKINLRGSYIVGDKWTDIETGVRAGVRTVFIHDGSPEADEEIRADYITKDLLDAAKWIVSREPEVVS